MTDKVTPTQADRALSGTILGIADAKVTIGQMQEIDRIIARHASQSRAEGMMIGARLGLDAAANTLASVFIQAHDTEWDAGVNCARQLYHDAIRTLSPADVVKGGE